MPLIHEAVEETRTVTTADTCERVTVPVLLDYHLNDGYDWQYEIARRGWATPGIWGSQGWNLGQWPYIIVATRTAETDTGVLYACAVYVEGDVITTWFRQQERCWDAISTIAFDCWKRGEAHGPRCLPEHADEMPDALRRPFTGLLP